MLVINVFSCRNLIFFLAFFGKKDHRSVTMDLITFVVRAFLSILKGRYDYVNTLYNGYTTVHFVAFHHICSFFIDLAQSELLGHSRAIIKLITM